MEWVAIDVYMRMRFVVLYCHEHHTCIQGISQNWTGWLFRNETKHLEVGVCAGARWTSGWFLRSYRRRSTRCGSEQCSHSRTAGDQLGHPGSEARSTTLIWQYTGDLARAAIRERQSRGHDLYGKLVWFTQDATKWHACVAHALANA